MKHLKFSICFLFCMAREGENSSSPLDSDYFSNKETEEFVISLVQDLISQEYATNKLRIISSIMKAMTENSLVENLTLIGSQNIYNDDGTIKEIRTIELDVVGELQKSCSTHPEPKSEEDEDEDIDINPEDFKNFYVLQNLTKSAILLGFELEVYNLEYKNKDEWEVQFYLNKDTCVVKNEGVYYINKTIEVDNKQAVEDYLKQMSEASIPSSKLYFDEHGKFLKNESIVVPELVAFASPGDGEPSLEIVKTALKAVVQSHLESSSKDEVPEKIQKFMESEIPNLYFVVTAGASPEGQYLHANFSLQISYHLIEFGSEKYSIFGLMHKI